MLDLSLFFMLVKIIMLFVLFMICKIVYEFVYIPYKYRVKYGKYKNVKMTEKFYPFLGDIKLIMQNEEDKKSKFHHFFEESLQNDGVDIRLVTLGSLIDFLICSTKGLDELERLIPLKIDRDYQKGKPLGNIVGGSLGLVRSDERWAKRRKEMTKMIGINFCSKHIPMMIETMDKHIGEIPLNEEVDLTELFTNVTFDIITKIFFGQDITENMEKIEYICPHTGEKSMLKFQEFYPKVVNEHFQGFINPKGKIFSFLAEYNLIDPYKTNAKNTNTYHTSLVKYLDNCEDQDSVYHELYKSGNFTKHECVMDALMMLLAGFDTSSRSISAAVCLLKKNPDKLKKLLYELKEHNIANITELSQDQYKTIYNECDYLTFVLKESLRIDSPIIQSVPYQSVKDCEIAGVKILKGEQIGINVAYCHYNPEQWQRPEEFLPERFDPENDLFYKPGTKENRHPKSYIPFTFGPRNCLGQTLAKLELKVLLSRFLTKIEYEIKDELLENDYRYYLLDGRHLYGKITKKM